MISQAGLESYWTHKKTTINEQTSDRTPRQTKNLDRPALSIIFFYSKLHKEAQQASKIRTKKRQVLVPYKTEIEILTTEALHGISTAFPVHYVPTGWSSEPQASILLTLISKWQQVCLVPFGPSGIWVLPLCACSAPQVHLQSRTMTGTMLVPAAPGGFTTPC